jgi:hypothetical protein
MLLKEFYSTEEKLKKIEKSLTQLSKAFFIKKDI